MRDKLILGVNISPGLETLSSACVTAHRVPRMRPAVVAGNVKMQICALTCEMFTQA